MNVGFDVHLANTIAIQQYSGLKYTDDKTDAWFLAHLLRLGILLEGTIYPPEQRAVRDLLRRRALLVHQRVTQKLSLQSLITRHSSIRLSSPQIDQLKTSDVDQWLSHHSSRLSAQINLKMIHALTESIVQMEKHIARYCMPTNNYKLVTSVSGIGPIIGQSILLETGPVDRFASVSHYASYARCVPTKKISNGKKKGEGNRKNGNKYLGHAFMEGAHYASIWEPKIKKYYHRKANKIHKIAAKKAVANKLAKAFYYMLTRNEVFALDRAFP